jgi:AraC family transcriptional regulator
MTANILDYIEKTALYIEAHIKQKLSLEQISEGAGISKFYLNRIFSVITGKTLMNYVNSRKLVSSLYELLYTNMHIIDIACEYNFSWENVFIRSFKREFGITPDNFRKTKCGLPVIPLVTSGILSAIGENSILVKPKMIFKPAFRIIGDRCSGYEPNYVGNFYITEFANDFYLHKRFLIQNKIEPVYYGHTLYDPDGGCDYTAGAEVPENEPPTEGLCAVQIPTNTYWVFKYIGLHSPYKITSPDFSYIKEAAMNWFTIAGQKRLPYHFERIDERICSESYCEMDLYFPIAEK